jgi:outer membrane protein TolC
VIDATKEVLDAIAVTHNSWQRLQEYERKFNAQSELNRITSLRVKHNLNNSLDALTTEGNMLISQDQEAVALRRTLLALLDLIKSIGGGYDNCGV